jgi:cytoskeleton protein RodZ
MDETARNPESSAAAPAAGKTAAPAAQVARSIGERLRAGRERSGLSVVAAGEKLHLDPKIIDALEADRYAEIGAAVYVRGHLKRYGDFVGEPGAELVAQYSAREARAPAPDLTQVPHAERRADPRRLMTPLIVAGCTGVLLVAVWWVLAGSGSSDARPSRAETSPAVAGDSSPVAAPVAVPVSATPTALNTAIPAPAPASAPVSSTQAREAPASVAEPAAPVKEAPPREIRLQLELTSDSWVEVYDSRGDRLFYDVASAGSVQSVSGRGPLRVVLGNAAGVTVAVDGQPREIPANAADGEGARFVVNRSGALSRAR